LTDRSNASRRTILQLFEESELEVIAVVDSTVTMNASCSAVIPGLGPGIHALGFARSKGVDPATKSRDDGV